MSLRLKHDMSHKVKKFKGSEYFCKPLYKQHSFGVRSRRAHSRSTFQVKFIYITFHHTAFAKGIPKPTLRDPTTSPGLNPHFWAKENSPKSILEKGKKNPKKGKQLK